MGKNPQPSGNPNPAQRSAASEFAAAFLIIFVICLIILVGLAFRHKVYWDEDQRDPVFMWNGFVFCLTKGPVVKIGGAAVFAFVGALITAAAGFFKGRSAVRIVTWLCLAGILLTVLLWIKLSQDDDMIGEISTLANRAFVQSPPEARVAQVSDAIDYLMGAFLTWWVVTAGTVLGLREALASEKFQWFRRFFATT